MQLKSYFQFITDYLNLKRDIFKREAILSGGYFTRVDIFRGGGFILVNFHNFPKIQSICHFWKITNIIIADVSKYATNLKKFKINLYEVNYFLRNKRNVRNYT
jgi:hypothetical protein